MGESRAQVKFACSHKMDREFFTIVRLIRFSFSCFLNLTLYPFWDKNKVIGEVNVF